MTCPTCGRRPSERYDGDCVPDRYCSDRIHDLADAAPELEKERDELREEADTYIKAASKWETLEKERDDLLAALRELAPAEFDIQAGMTANWEGPFRRVRAAIAAAEEPLTPKEPK